MVDAPWGSTAALTLAVLAPSAPIRRLPSDGAAGRAGVTGGVVVGGFGVAGGGLGVVVTGGEAGDVVNVKS